MAEKIASRRPADTGLLTEVPKAGLQRQQIGEQIVQMIHRVAAVCDEVTLINLHNQLLFLARGAELKSFELIPADQIDPALRALVCGANSARLMNADPAGRC